MNNVGCTDAGRNTCQDLSAWCELEMGPSKIICDGDQ